MELWKKQPMLYRKSDVRWLLRYREASLLSSLGPQARSSKKGQGTFFKRRSVMLEEQCERIEQILSLTHTNTYIHTRLLKTRTSTSLSPPAACWHAQTSMHPLLHASSHPHLHKLACTHFRTLAFTLTYTY
eukprot:673607-Pelagomonas_calceolata.AAC.1